MSTEKSSQVTRSTVRSTWRWMWPDLLIRLLPMCLVSFLFIVLFHLPPSFLGLQVENFWQQIALGVAVGLVMCIFAITYRTSIVGPWFRRPTGPDQALQSFFYLCINAPIEELFFRGLVLGAVTEWMGWIGWGWLVSTVLYTLYHRLGKWSWRSVGGVGLAGIVFSLVYLVPSGPHSLLPVTIVHGLTTSGFLSWGDEVLYRRWKQRNL